MKKALFLLLAIPMMALAQTEPAKVLDKNVLSLNLMASDPASFGLHYEYGFYSENNKYRSLTFGVASAATTLEKNNVEVVGTGFLLEFGKRNYWGKEKGQGVYMDNSLLHSQVKFSKDGFEGKYTYWSIINPELGYKVVIAKKIVLEAGAGIIWKWEVNTKSDLDNKDFDNLVPKFTIKAGYRF